MMRKIYLASSWRNTVQQDLVAILRNVGHEVYDFKNPEGGTGFSWSSIDPNWQGWTPEQLKQALKHPLAVAGHARDHAAMEWSDTGVLLLPCGSSAHLEAGWLAGKGKPTCVYAPTVLREADLMYLSLTKENFFTGLDPLLKWLTCPN